MRNGFLVSAIGVAVLWSMGLAAAADRIFIADQTVDSDAKDVLIPVRVDTSQVRHGFSIALKYDQAKITVKSLEFAGTASAAVLTAGQGWQGGQILDADGKLHWGVVLDITDPITNTIPVADNQVVANLKCDIVTVTADTTTDITPRDDLGTPPGGWSNILSYRGDPPTHPTLEAGTITIKAVVNPNETFVRGDCNDDGLVDLSDAIFSLGFQFMGTQAPRCKAACNNDDSSAIDLTDAIYLLSFKFLGGPPPVAPYPACGGNAPSDDSTKGCIEFNHCP
jgi:hypothetical protein